MIIFKCESHILLQFKLEHLNFPTKKHVNKTSTIIDAHSIEIITSKFWLLNKIAWFFTGSDQQRNVSIWYISMHN